MSDKPTSEVTFSKIVTERQGERFISLGELVHALELTAVDQHHLDQMLKDEATVYWLRHGGVPGDIRKAPQHVMVRSRAPGPHYSDPEYPQAMINE